MKFAIRSTSGYLYGIKGASEDKYGNPLVEIETLQELMSFIKGIGKDVIMQPADEYNPEYHTIEVYDDYRE